MKTRNNATVNSSATENGATANTVTNDTKLTVTRDSNILDIAAHVLEMHGTPMHHTTLIAAIVAAGLDNDKINTVNPKMWADERNATSDKPSRFHLYGKSVFGLKVWGDKFGTDTDVAATYFKRSTAPVAAPTQLTVEQLNARRAALVAQLAEVDEAIVARQAADEKAAAE